MEKLGQNNIYSQFLGNKAILRTYKGADLINEYVPLYTPPVDWRDIRMDCPANSIALYAGHTADYSQYDNLGFTANCVGGYKVYIDGTQYGSTYASGSKCSITWSNYTATAGEAITSPSALTAHKIWIEPATEGNNITAFHLDRVAASGNEQQGLLWAHFNLTNAIKIINAFGSETQIRNTLLEAVTAKNNLITYNVSNSIQGLYSSFAFCSSLEYLPVLKADNQQYPSGTYLSFYQVPAKKVVIKNNNGNELFGLLRTYKGEEFIVENGLTLGSAMTPNSSANSPINLKKFPKINQNKYATFKLYNAPALEPTDIDDRFNDIRTAFHFYGTATNFTNLKSLRVSNQAPFDYATPPQINVNYTGLDRSALVQLFNDLPYNVGYTVTGSPTINNGVVSGFSGSDYLKAENQSAISLNNINSYFARVKFTTSEITGINAMICGYLSSFFGFRLSTGPSGSLRCYIFDAKTKKFGDFLVGQLQANKTYIAEQWSNQNECVARVSGDNGITWTTINPTPSTTQIVNFQNYVFGNGAQGAFNGTIDLNNTYIKINDVYWFRGQPAMTKTLSCVGATGTADLTAEDKAIATNKGWSLTLN